MYIYICIYEMYIYIYIYNTYGTSLITSSIFIIIFPITYDYSEGLQTHPHALHG